MNFNRFPAKTISGFALTGALMAGCSENPALIYSPDEVRPVNADGFIANGVNVRTSPQRIETPDFNNSCAKLAVSVVVESVDAVISDGIGIDSNGDWIGLDREVFADKIPDDCASEYGDMLWVAATQTNLTIEPTQQYDAADER